MPDYNTNTEGTLIRYGEAEPWKAIAQHIGRTKPSRMPAPELTKRKKNDGRPPDTAKELLKKPPKKSTLSSPMKRVTSQPNRSPSLPAKLGTTKSNPSKASPKDLVLGNASYPWKKNSCWLDSSLELLFRALMRDFDDFTSACSQEGSQTTKGLLSALYELFKARQSQKSDDLNITSILGKQRDDFRKLLKKGRIIDSVDGYESVFVRAVSFYLA